MRFKPMTSYTLYKPLTTRPHLVAYTVKFLNKTKILSNVHINNKCSKQYFISENVASYFYFNFSYKIKR